MGGGAGVRGLMQKAACLERGEAIARAAALRRRVQAARRLAAQKGINSETQKQWLTLAEQYEKLARYYEAFGT